MLLKASAKGETMESADDSEREQNQEKNQETIYVLQNKSLMTQIAASLATHNRQKVHRPTAEQINEITGN